MYPFPTTEMHSFVFVMIGPKTEIDNGVARALAPFDEELSVESYRVHLDHPQVQMMAKHYGIEPANLNQLAKQMKDWTFQDGGIDREGLYYLSTSNPDGRWDWYEIGGRWDGYVPYSQLNAIRAGTLAKATYLKKCLPSFVLTPDGEWLEYERFYFSSDWKESQKESLDDVTWLSIVREVLSKWPNHRVVCVDIHS